MSSLGDNSLVKLFTGQTFIEGVTGAFKPDVPDLPETPKRFLDDERKQAEASATRRRRRARGAFGLGDTALTGPQGLAPGSSLTGSAPSLGVG